MRKNPAVLLSLLLVLMTMPCQAASEQDNNKKVARAFFEEVLGQGKLENYAESHTPDFVGHGSERDFTLAEDMAAARQERNWVPDLQMVVNQMVAEGDLVVVYWTAWGTNTQPGMGLPATGKPFKTPGMTLFRFRAGKISEEWGVWCMLSVLKQLGVLCTGVESQLPAREPKKP